MQKLWRDLRYGVRLMQKRSDLTLVAMIMLAFCIGADSTVFSLIDSLFLHPLPFKNIQRLVIWWGAVSFTRRLREIHSVADPE